MASTAPRRWRTSPATPGRRGGKSGTRATQFTRGTRGIKCVIVTRRQNAVHCSYKLFYFKEILIGWLQWTALRCLLQVVEILQTIFGSVKIAMNGFTYVKNKHGPNGRIYWRCESRDCLGSCTTDELYLAGEPMQGRSFLQRFCPSLAAFLLIINGARFLLNFFTV